MFGSHPPRPAVSGAGSVGNDRLSELLIASARGDSDAFADLYDATSSRIYGVIMRVLRSPDHAAEVTQEVYVEVWRQSARYDAHRGSVFGWMSTMAHRRAVDRVRSVSSDTARDDRYAYESATREVDQVWEGVEQTLDVERVRRALGSLSALQREAIQLSYFGGYTQVQTAELLDVPLGTVKTRIRDGLIRLRDTMGIEHV